MCVAELLNKLGFAASAAIELSVIAGSVTSLKSTMSANWGLKSGSEAIRVRCPSNSASVILP